MPRKRRVPKLARRQLRRADLGIDEIMDFWSGGSSRPLPELLSDWAAVREEMLPEWQEKHRELRNHYRAEVARLSALISEEADGGALSGHYRHLLEWEEEHLAEAERRQLPFAEFVYQRVLAGEPPNAAGFAYQYYRAGNEAAVGDDEDEDDGGWQ